jgi:hypothetical protein
MQELQEVLSLIDGYIGGAQWFAYFLLFTGVFFTDLPEISTDQILSNMQ